MIQIDKSIIDNNTQHIQYCKLKDLPIVNKLYNTKQQAIDCKKYQIAINYFKTSKLHCLKGYIQPKQLFQHYAFKTGISVQFKKHCYDIAQKLYSTINRNNLQILDIGGNDGTLLKQFYKFFKDSNLYNVQPSDVSKCCDSNIKVYNTFFNKQFIKNNNNNKKYNIIATTNVFQHLYDIDQFVYCIKQILERDGVWILQFPYWYEGLMTGQFDQVYHQHIYFHTLTPLISLLKKHGLQIKDANYYGDIHGGTMNLSIQYIGIYMTKQQHDNITKFVNKQKNINEKTLSDFQLKTNKIINNAKQFLYKNKDKTIYAYGASAKGCVFLNQIQANDKSIKYIIDDTDVKQNKYMGGVGIKIVNNEILKNNPPDIIIILSHNVASQIVYKIKKINKNIKCYVMIPQLQEIICASF